jgi:peptidyl-tRNA hydrolase
MDRADRREARANEEFAHRESIVASHRRRHHKSCLGKFAASERDAAREAVEEAVKAVEGCLKEGLTAAMNQFNRRKGDVT